MLAVGAVVGMTIAIRGGENVIWYRHAPETFPYIKVSFILSSLLWLFGHLFGRPVLSQTRLNVTVRTSACSLASPEQHQPAHVCCSLYLQALT